MFLRPKLSILYSMYPIGIIYIYIIFTHVFAHICTAWRGKHSNCWNVGKNNFKGNRFIGEMLVENNIKGEAFQLLKCLCKKKFEGGSIQTAEKLVKKTISRGKHSNCWNAGRKTFSREKHSNCWKAGKKQFQGGSILIDEMLEKKNSSRGETF